MNIIKFLLIGKFRKKIIQIVIFHDFTCAHGGKFPFHAVLHKMQWQALEMLARQAIRRINQPANIPIPIPCPVLQRIFPFPALAKSKYSTFSLSSM